MWVAPSTRGLGLGRRLLTELERLARDHGARMIRLETHRSLSEAIALYRSAGYHEVPPFNDEPYAHHWFEKRLRQPRLDEPVSAVPFERSEPSAAMLSTVMNALRPVS
jgi:L-amino acid N-acyltransferase YncA